MYIRRLRAYDDIRLLSTHPDPLSTLWLLVIWWLLRSWTGGYHCLSNSVLIYCTSLPISLLRDRYPARDLHSTRYEHCCPDVMQVSVLCIEGNIIPWMNPCDLYVVYCKRVLLPTNTVAFMLCWSPFSWHRPLRPRGSGPVNHGNSAHCYTGRRETIAFNSGLSDRIQFELFSRILRILNIVQTVRSTEYLHTVCRCTGILRTSTTAGTYYFVPYYIISTFVF